MTQFSDLGLSGPILQALAAADYDTPTPIQAQAIPLVLQGKDLLGIAQTGTGKTAAFVLPSLDTLARANKRPGPRSCRMLILSPTRELASQIADNAVRYARFVPINVTTAFGGVPIGKQQRALAGGVDILVATPGRLIDLIEQRMLSLEKVEILVLDEATSALDSEVEVAIQRSLDDLMRGKTVIAIAHRLSTIAAMDRLIVLDEGRIVEEGTHQQLLQAGGIYAALWAHQSGGFLGETADAEKAEQ